MAARRHVGHRFEVETRSPHRNVDAARALEAAGGVMATSRAYGDLPLVYLAGPYSHPDPVANTHAVIALASELIDEGLVTPFVPHLTLLWHAVLPRPLEFWYAYDVALLQRCDALFRVSGESSGADREVQFASTHGIPVFTQRDELAAWAHSQRVEAGDRRAERH